MKRSVCLLPLVFCGGCFLSATGVDWALPMTVHEAEMIKTVADKGGPDATNFIREYMSRRPAVRISGLYSDGLEKVARKLGLKVNRKSGELEFDLSSDHDVNTEALKVLSNTVTSLASAATGGGAQQQAAGSSVDGAMQALIAAIMAEKDKAIADAEAAANGDQPLPMARKPKFPTLKPAPMPKDTVKP